ncbi:MAG: hypothetical protein GY849_21495 [Deltaproteobacteria bacterium]|nr:hypothetical protein [Deltaproteobacteria bacterium]
MSLPLPSSSDLRARQSVRATFRLSERAIDTLSIVATHLGIKQKSLFDHLIDDPGSLNVIARDIRPDRFSRLKRTQKTYVLSRRTLCSLEEASRDFDAPRDALVEYSIQRLLPVIDEEREKHLKRKEILGEISAYLKLGEKILRKSKRLFDEDEPVAVEFERAMIVCKNAIRNIEDFVEKGKIIEDF